MDLSIKALTQARPMDAGETQIRRFASAKAPDAAQQFEAFVLQSFVEEMLPKDSENVYGGGIAGDYWRSMLAEKLADVMAERGDVGIAHYVREGAGSGVALTGAAGAPRSIPSLPPDVAQAGALLSRDTE